MQSIDSWISCHAAFTPDKTAIKFEGQDLSYKSFAGNIATAAGYLVDQGISHGDRVTYLGLNRPEMLSLLFACARLGAILVPLNWRLTPKELSGIVGDAGASLLFFDKHYSSNEFLEVALSSDGCKALPIEKLARCTNECLVGGGKQQDPILIVYTSGTTGKPKGAVLTQEALLYNALNSRHMHGMTSDDLILVALPLFHVGGLNIQLTPGLYLGATIELHERFDPKAAIRSLLNPNMALGVLVPATMEAVMATDEWQTADFFHLRALGTGSMIVPVGLIKSFEDKNCSVIQVYGSTETCPIAAYQAIGEGKTHPASTGKTALHNQIRLTNDKNEIITSPDVMGEIEVAGPSTLSYYWGNTEETTKSIVDGWFKTGDLGSWDAEGYLYFKDRKKNLIISGGENISPAEIEGVIALSGKVKETVVVGMPDDRWGEVPIALIVLHPNESTDDQEFLDLFRENLARFKHPKKMIFTDQLPRNAMGKVQPHLVREQLLEP